MGMICYAPKTKVPYDSVSISKYHIRFTHAFHRAFLRDCENVILYYDENARQIGIEPTDTGTGLKVMCKGTCLISVSGFLNAFKLAFERPVLKRAIKKDGMVIIQL